MHKKTKHDIIRAVITVENRNKKKYYVISGRSHFCLESNSGCDVDSDEVKLVRAYSRNRFVDLILRFLFFILTLVFVFLESDYENDETLLVNIKYNCRAENDGLTLIIMSSTLLNIEKKGALTGKFTINKHLLIAHLISVFMYSLGLTGLILFLGLFSIEESAFKVIFYILSGVAACVSAIAISMSIIRYKKTLRFLHEIYDNYIY